MNNTEEIIADVKTKARQAVRAETERVLIERAESLVLTVKFRLWILLVTFVITSASASGWWSVAIVVLFFLGSRWLDKMEPALIRKKLGLTPLPKKDRRWKTPKKVEEK